MEISSLFGLTIVLLALLIVVWLYMKTAPNTQKNTSNERLRNIVATTAPKEPNEPSVDMVDFNHDDPKFSKYTRQFRDAMGLDGSDYYYENDTMFRQGVSDEKYGASLFESEYGLPDTRGNVEYPFNPEDRWLDVPSGRMQGSVESAEYLVGGSPETDDVMSRLQSNALFNGAERYTDLTQISQADALFY